ncbi:transformation system protein [Campylobacter concisus]|uniref:Transformation system protein n=1 Tax=Campylobacter concisus TaxID=199 RepID=A0A7S9NEV0_9BACT|nr:transformation system protein [Campylobacter concisus]QPH84466.1 transformation system protein [Campylobacter concisus]
MLELQEIQRIEKLYEEYEKKNKNSLLKLLSHKKLSLLIITILLIVFIFSAFLFFSNTKNKKETTNTPTLVEKNLTIQTDIKEKNITFAETNVSKNILEDGKQKSEQAKERFESDKKQDELAEKIAKKLEQSIKLNEDNKEQAPDKKQRSGGGWLKLNLPTENENIQNEQPLPNEEIIELEPKAKPKIDIQISSENNEISILKENFNKNKNPETALKIARKCYQDKRYSDTIKWALSANNLDSSIEESWLMFAKAKYMLKQKDDALRALEEYNKNKNKPEINELINKIKSDTL